MESELLATQKMRHELEEHLSYLEKTKQRLSLLFKAREIEAVNSKKGLLDCIKTLRELEGRNSSVLHDEMRPLIREMHQLRANYKDMKKRITDAAATIESLERSNENKRTDLLITEMEARRKKKPK